MKLIDNNAIVHWRKDRKQLKQIYFLTPEVVLEASLGSQKTRQEISDKMMPLEEEPIFDEAIYLSWFSIMLNKHSQVSFFNMTGFGDISILATLHMLFEIFHVDENTKNASFNVTTEDRKLADKINAEFQNRVQILGYESLL